MERFYAHSLEGQPKEAWQLLEEHLRNVAALAQGFAEVFAAGEWGYLAGLWHDLGKYAAEFQRYLEGDGSRVDHATAGAQHAVSVLGGYGRLLAYGLAGHHAGLPNGRDNNDSCLEERLAKRVPDYAAYADEVLHPPAKGELHFPFEPEEHRNGFQFSFFTRMLYSCLVDADFLDTESFIDPTKAALRKGYPALASLLPKLETHLATLQQKAKPSEVNRHRAVILRQSLAAAEEAQGLYSLTVPTGGGKTLSSLAFALRHALRHGLDRVIYVIPYTSIIEQNAMVLRNIFGDGAVLEHHSNYEPPVDDRRSKLAAENWDAPIVVTTNVQFFESLFRTRSSRCRRIHNIANSVVILDEAQMLPVELLRPCLEVLRELAAYRTTVVLCTATQPALREEDGFAQGLRNVREIIDNPQELLEALARVRTVNLGRATDAELVGRLGGQEQVLCVVNTRRHARSLFEMLADKGGEGVHHLSGLMCPAHRSEVLTRIRQALKEGRPCRVVSTQLIEAGVDIDFPVVYRSVAGIDSIAQAAGRCNREGGLPQPGRVFVFEPEEGVSAGPARQAAQSAEPVLRRHEDPLSLAAVREYFQSHYWRRAQDLDKHGILRDFEEGARRGDYPFREVDAKFKLIETVMEPVIIPWNSEAEELIDALCHAEHPGSYSRRLQRYTVQIPRFALAELRADGDVERLRDQFNILINRSCYSEKIGLCSGKQAFIEAENLIV